MEKFFVLDVKKDTYKSFKSYYSLLNFVKSVPFGSIGNNPLDVRWRYTPERKEGRSPYRLHYIFPWYYTNYTKTFEVVSYVVYDQFLNGVDCKRVERDAAHADDFIVSSFSYRPWKTNSPNYPGFRNGPVPYTGVRHWGHYHRKVRTTQELRANEDHKEFTRGKRRNLPSWYDDVRIAERDNKYSWKKQKKRKQWM